MSAARIAMLQQQLDLARRDLALAIEERAGYTAQANALDTLAAQAGTDECRRARNTLAIRHRLRAMGCDGPIADIRERIAQLECMLAQQLLPPVQLSREQLAAVDETAGLCEVPA